MVLTSENCPREERCIAGGRGLAQGKALASKEQMYGHARLFSQFTLQPGCSMGEHVHDHETEFYYLLSGEAVFNDNGTEVSVRAGDVCVTGGGERHGLDNRGTEPVVLIALIVLE